MKETAELLFALIKLRMNSRGNTALIKMIISTIIILLLGIVMWYAFRRSTGMT